MLLAAVLESRKSGQDSETAAGSSVAWGASDRGNLLGLGGHGVFKSREWPTGWELQFYYQPQQKES
jgi:hypothetical protein